MGTIPEITTSVKVAVLSRRLPVLLRHLTVRKEAMRRGDVLGWAARQFH